MSAGVIGVYSVDRYDAGVKAGIEKGRAEGVAKERVEGIKNLFFSLCDIGLSRKDAITRTADSYHVSKNDVKNIILGEIVLNSKDRFATDEEVQTVSEKLMKRNDEAYRELAKW